MNFIKQLNKISNLEIILFVLLVSVLIIFFCKNNKEGFINEKFNKDGYIIIDLQLDNDEIDNIVSDMYKLTNKAMSKYNNTIP